MVAGCAAWIFMGIPTASAANLGKVTPQELKKLMDQKADIVVVDAQVKEAYDVGHIPGAVNLPAYPPIASPGNLPKNKDLIVYCACAHEEDAIDLANQLMTKFGYTRLKLLEGGWIKWVELGYVQEKAKKK
jgi:rhodanese-related sulfurtransferase